MKLKSIVILGFKSFADKTTLIFSPGITGIVGPNGCGKSNISDAFRWVLGEQSAKSMRGNKMHDVIFSGTTKRSALNIAEVTLTFTDTENSLPTEYSEVSITRRVHRSGESEYFINRKPVRLKDVQALFLDTGVGKDSFAIFEQGKIDQIILYSPVERRYIFEEAAGISRFLHRKNEAMRKLEQVDLNLSRVKDILQEVEKQCLKLEQQVEKAKTYKENKTKLETQEKLFIVLKGDFFKQNILKLFQETQTNKELLFQKQALNESLTKDMSVAKSLFQTKEKLLQEIRESLIKMRSEKEMQLREQQGENKRLVEIAQKEKLWQSELEALLLKNKQRQEERAELEQQQEILSKDVNQQELQLNSNQQKVKQTEILLRELQNQFQTEQQAHFLILQENNRIDSEIKQIKVRQEGLQERIINLQTQLSTNQSTAKESQHHLSEKQHETQELTHSLEEQKIQFADFENSFQTIIKQIQERQSELSHIKHNIAGYDARKQILMRLRDECEGFSPGSKRLLQESKNPESPLFQMIKNLYEFLIPKSGCERFLDQSLRPYTQTLVVETLSQLNRVLSFAKEKNIKDFSIACLEIMSIPQMFEASKNPLLEMVESNAVSVCMLSNIFHVNNLDDAIHLKKNSTGISVCLNEGFIDSFGVLFFHNKSENNIFMREAELRQLEQQLENLNVSKASHEEALSTLYQKRDQVNAEKAAMEKAVRRDEMRLLEVNLHLKQISQEIEKANLTINRIESEIASSINSHKEMQSKLDELSQRHSAAFSKINDYQGKIKELGIAVEQKAAQYKQDRQLLQDQETSFKQTSEENKKLIHNLHVIDIKEQESLNHEKRLISEIQSSSELVSRLRNQSSERNNNLQEIEINLKILSEEYSSAELHVSEIREKIDSLSSKIQQLNEEKRELEENIFRKNLNREQLENTAQALSNDLQEKYQIDIEEARAQTIPPGTSPAISLEQLEKQVRMLKNKLEIVEDINLNSIEEQAELKSRHEFMLQQIIDLESSKQELLTVIGQSEEESRSLFSKTFEIIRTNFQKNFQILFNGGEADLQFTENGDILQSGIEILAKPPGKQMRALSLLSGGEKCLTAMALLFSIFEVKPSPFCILDEIDAPLDDTNVERFLKVVKHFADRCQFVIITHNKRTMNIADKLCGVSMQEKGVSKLISVEFSTENDKSKQLAFLS